MTPLVDTSVVLTSHEEGESDVLNAHRAWDERLLLLDLVVDELGNVLLRPLRQPASVVAAQSSLLRVLCGPVVHPCPPGTRRPRRWGSSTALTFYDAGWAAAVQVLDGPLVSADRQLLAAGLAIAVTDAAGRAPA